MQYSFSHVAAQLGLHLSAYCLKQGFSTSRDPQLVMTASNVPGN